VQEFRNQGIDSVLLYQAFDPDILQKVDLPEKRQFNVVFIGSLLAGKDYHNRRARFLDYLLKNGIDLQAFVNVQGFGLGAFLKRASLYYAKHLINLTGTKFLFSNTTFYRKSLNLSKPQLNLLSSRLKKRINPPVFGLDMFQLLANSQICLNMHVDVAGKYAANMRMFEATGMGALLLTEHKINIFELFEPDKEVVTYTSFEDALEKLLWLKQNPQKVIEIARAGQKRTLTQHNYLNRAKILLNKIQKHLS
jgi:hypothetical protein